MNIDDVSWNIDFKVSKSVRIKNRKRIEVSKLFENPISNSFVQRFKEQIG